MIAGQADLITTANFKDFISKDIEVVIPGKHAVYRGPNHEFQIVHPYLMMDWIRSGELPEVVRMVQPSMREFKPLPKSAIVLSLAVAETRD
jgi:hypothetical protein